MSKVTIQNQTRQKLRVGLWTKEIKNLNEFQPFQDMQLINPGEHVFEFADDGGKKAVHVALTKDHVNKRGKLGFKDVLTSELIDVKPGGAVEVKGSERSGYDFYVR